MKARDLKKYFRDFPFLEKVLLELVFQEQTKIDSRDIALIATRKWRSLDLSDRSLVQDIGTDRMRGNILHVIIWEKDRWSTKSQWRSAPIGAAKGFWAPFSGMNIGQAIAEVDSNKDAVGRNTSISTAIIRLAWVNMGEWKSPVKIEINRIPIGKQVALANFE